MTLIDYYENCEKWKGDVAQTYIDILWVSIQWAWKKKINLKLKGIMQSGSANRLDNVRTHFMWKIK